MVVWRGRTAEKRNEGMWLNGGCGMGMRLGEKSRRKWKKKEASRPKEGRKKKDPAVKGQADRGQGKVRGHSCQPHARIGAIIIVI